MLQRSLAAAPETHFALPAYRKSASRRAAASAVAALARRARAPLPSGTTSRSTLVVKTPCTVPPPKGAPLVLKAAFKCKFAVVSVGAPSTKHVMSMVLASRLRREVASTNCGSRCGRYGSWVVLVFGAGFCQGGG